MWLLVEACPGLTEAVLHFFDGRDDLGETEAGLERLPINDEVSSTVSGPHGAVPHEVRKLFVFFLYVVVTGATLVVTSALLVVQCLTLCHFSGHLVAIPFVLNNFLLLVRPEAPSSVLAPSSDARSP